MRFGLGVEMETDRLDLTTLCNSNVTRDSARNLTKTNGTHDKKDQRNSKLRRENLPVTQRVCPEPRATPTTSMGDMIFPGREAGEVGETSRPRLGCPVKWSWPGTQEYITPEAFEDVLIFYSNSKTRVRITIFESATYHQPLPYNPPTRTSTTCCRKN